MLKVCDMVNENTETSSSNNCFNFQCSSSNQNFRSLSNSLNNPKAVNSVNATKQLDLLVATNQTLNKKKCDLLSVSADNLSWKFFDQIDSLDTRLRKEENTFKNQSSYRCEVSPFWATDSVAVCYTATSQRPGVIGLESVDYLYCTSVFPIERVNNKN
uniref:Uncharacterized protein n=1 Tax=Glossina austeni TaxID=7395 RepID=A0A1A9UZR2_GLOAU